jgi:predicted glycoside hydrolase/deacetylase ChbG (UPF0249 family)
MIKENIILVADDFGKSAKANENILNLARAGKLDRVSVMVDGNISAEEAKELLASNVKIDIHLELIWQKRRRNLLGDRALRQIAVFFLNYVWGDWHVPENPRSGKKSVSKEWKGQIEKFKEIFGRVPDGISSHEHTHFFPVYFGVAVRLAKYYEIVHIRYGKRSFLGNKNTKQLILNFLRRINSRIFFRSKLDSTDYFASLDWIDDVEYFAKNILDGKIELACHPERKGEYDAVEKYF